MGGLYESLGSSDFFSVGGLVDNTNIQASGKSELNPQSPFSWTWNAFGANQGILDVEMNYDMSQLIGDLHSKIGIRDPMARVNLNYNFGTEAYSKEVWYCSHFGTRHSGSTNGNYLESHEVLASVSKTIGASTIDINMVAPIKKDFMVGSKIDFKIGAKDQMGYIATQIALDNMENPNVKIGLEDEKLSVALEHIERKDWNFSFAKMVNPNSTVGFETNLTTHSVVASKESAECSMKFKINNEDKFVLAVTKSYPSFTANIEVQGDEFLKKNGSLKFGYGLNFNL